MYFTKNRMFGAFLLGVILIFIGNTAQAASPHWQVQQTTLVRETFEGQLATWLVGRVTAGTGSITQSATQVDANLASARLATTATNSQAFLTATFSDPASAHAWQERPGTFVWQRTRMFVPATTIAALGATQYLTLARFEATATGTRWELRVHSGGQLYVAGTNHDTNALQEFQIYGTLPTDRWFDLEMGLHSQNGPGVKRAFAVILDGTFYGWYHQGRLSGETYNRAAIGIVETTSSAALTVYVDQWYELGTTALPGGPDHRPTDTLQTIDYRTLSGERWQIDWATWGNDLRLHPVYGLYSARDRFQSGMNIDRMPNLASGWAEIEIDWSSGTPAAKPSSYFGPMVGFRKEINREENLEVIPIGNGNGTVDLALEAWLGSPVILARWPMPLAASVVGSHIPEPGDRIRARWEQVSTTDVRVQAFYYDASAKQWTAAIDVTTNLGAVSNGSNTVNFNDGYHLASSITSDSINYSIRQFTVGTLDTFLLPGAPTPTPTVATATPIPPTATNTPLPPTATNTPLPPTATDTALPPTATETTLLPTATETALPPTATESALSPTATASALSPTATETTLSPTATETTLPPTATESALSPTATDTALPPTNTPLPPTATNTPLPPTVTNTPLPPTDTPLPPTATNTPLPPTATPIPDAILPTTLKAVRSPHGQRVRLMQGASASMRHRH